MEIIAGPQILGQTLRNSSGMLPTQDAHGSENTKPIYAVTVDIGIDVRGYGRYKGYQQVRYYGWGSFYDFKPRNFHGVGCATHNLKASSC